MSELREKMNEREALRHAASQAELKPTLNYMKFDEDKLVLTLMGDEHIGSKYYDGEYHKEILDWCWENDSPIILMGDELETATRYSVGAGVYEQDEILEEQFEHCKDLYKPFADEGLLIGLHEGNHEARVYKDTGLNISKRLAKELGVPYFGWGKLHYIRVGDENYSLYTTHGASGARMPHTKIKGALDLANVAESEIYAMGHLHQLSHHIRTFYTINKKNKTVEEDQKHFILTGCYLGHWGSYGHIKNYEPSRKGSAKVKLHGDKHMIRVSL